MFPKSSIVDTLTVLLVTICSSQRKTCHYLEIYWYVFYGNCTEYRNLHYKSPNSAQIRENTDQKNFQYGIFSRSATINIYRKLLSKKTNLPILKSQIFDERSVCRTECQKQPPEVLYYKAVPKNSSKFTEKDLCRSLSLNKVAG